MSKEYNIGIYIRLSMADEDTGYGSKAVSDSIGNPRTLINRFLEAWRAAQTTAWCCSGCRAYRRRT